MAKKYWEMQLVNKILENLNIGKDRIKITNSKLNWDIELDGQPLAEFKCQKLKNIMGVKYENKFYENQLMVAELTGFKEDKLGHFFHLPDALQYYVIGLISIDNEQKVELFYFFNWKTYKRNIENILKFEYGEKWEQLILENKLWEVDKKNYKIIEQPQCNGKSKWIVWLHNVFDLETMEIKQWGLKRCYVDLKDVDKIRIL